MSRPLIVSPEAQDDLAEIRAWYENQRPGLGRAFLDSVEHAFERIERSPSSFETALRNVRLASTPRFPYIIYFRCIEDDLVVIGVFHNRRDPRAWRSRVLG
jgi:plasmid stabilization system protein ParE